MIMIEQDARMALSAKATAEADLARLALCPPWRHAAFAGVMAALVATPAVALPWRFVVLALASAAIALIVRSDRRRLGVFVNGYRRGKTRWVVGPLLAAVLALYAGSIHAGLTLGRPTISLMLGLLAFAVAHGGSIIWQKVFVRELGA